MKDKTTAGILAILLGTFGVHKFYLGEPGMGCLYFLLSVTGLTTIMGIVEGIYYLAMSDEAFHARYNPAVILAAMQQAPPRGLPTTGRNATPWYKTVRPRTAADREQIVLAMVQDTGGSVTPAEVAVHTQLSLQQAHDVLHELEVLGVCQTEYDPHSGLPRYIFPEFLRHSMTGEEGRRLENPLDLQ